MADEVLRIIELQAENVKRLKAVRIKPDKTLVRIEGRNAQGKSSVLDAIAAALGGGKWNPELPVRQGEKKASVKLTLGDLIVERRWTAAGGTTLEVTANGAQLRSPQAILDKLVGDLTFDPLSFVHMKPVEQSGILKRLAGLDFSALDAERDQVFAERTVVNRDAKNAEASLGTMPPKPTQEAPVNVRELADKQQAAITHNRNCDEVEAAIARAVAQSQSIERQLAELNAAHANAKSVEREAVKRGEGLKRQEVADLGAAVSSAEQINASIANRANWEKKAAMAKAKVDEADKLTARIEAIDAEKERKLRAAKFPLDGLSIGPLGPTLNGVPFLQASSAEQLRTSVAIGLAGKPKARIMLCRDGSLLDGENLKALSKIAEEFDAQVFVERVADVASPSAVYIEDGEVVTS